MLLGVDTGGTFTDFVLFDGQKFRIHKVLSTPDAPERAILQGVAELGLAAEALTVAHGSTVATNAVLEGKGVSTAYITNRGLADVLSIGRQAREALYDLTPPPVAPPVPEAWCLEVGGRLAANGAQIEPLADADLVELNKRLAKLAPDAVAINLLFSFLDATQERRIAQAIPEGIFVSRSSDVLAEYREYERGVATWLNAYVGPLMQGYLERLDKGLAAGRLLVMQSSGGLVAAEQAAGRAVHLLLSGPAGGLMGARFVGEKAGCPRLLTFDMGGTSTDVALIKDEIRLTTEGRIGRYPVAVPMVDMHTIGAGGGSIARVDAGGMLQVGPESAGADPGPACYGRGGQQATVTDANLVLGRLRPDAFLGGTMRLDEAAARRVLEPLAAALGGSVEEAAEGVIRVANEHMAGALRVISVQRGEDPAEFALTCFGGAGGLHVCALAELLGMRRALVPVSAGVLSALGMLAAPRTREVSRTLLVRLDQAREAELEQVFAELVADGSAQLEAEGVEAEVIRARLSLDMRYAGQSSTLNLDWSGLDAAGQAFHAAHQARFGHRLALPVELVNLRAGLSGPKPSLDLPAIGRARAEPTARVGLHGLGTGIPVYVREALGVGQAFSGPALVTETVSTTLVAPGWSCRVDAIGNLHLARK
ncbi:MAG: hydantoinase/oxoprolinase family protein [Gammaproteobacteria bacterium]|jgi:N-methylhydantoinase A